MRLTDETSSQCFSKVISVAYLFLNFSPIYLLVKSCLILCTASSFEIVPSHLQNVAFSSLHRQHLQFIILENLYISKHIGNSWGKKTIDFKMGYFPSAFS